MSLHDRRAHQHRVLRERDSSGPKQVTEEDRLLVTFRCMPHAGFETVGDYFAAVLNPEYNQHSKVYHSVAAFLQCQGQFTRTHPISIVEQIFSDPRSKTRPETDGELHLDLPRHALPPSQRLSSQLPEGKHNNTRKALINWVWESC
jgi:hypothetical protein